MGRKKSNYICPKCGKPGYLSDTPSKYGIHRRVIHYDHKTGNQPSCYIDKVLEKRNIDNLLKGPDFKIHKDQELPLGEIAVKTYMLYKDIGMDIYRLDRKIEINHITDQFIIEIVDLLWKYLRLYVKGYLPFITFKANTFEFLEYMKLEIKFVNFLKKLPAMLTREYKVLLKKGSLIDKSGRNRNISNYKMKEDLRRRIKSIEFEISLVQKNNYFSDLFRFWFLIELVTEYLFVKYDLPKKLIRRKHISLKLSEGHFGSEKYASQYSGLS